MKYFYFILISFLIIACTEESNNNIENIDVAKLTSSEKNTLDEFFQFLADNNYSIQTASNSRRYLELFNDTRKQNLDITHQENSFTAGELSDQGKELLNAFYTDIRITGLNSNSEKHSINYLQQSRSLMKSGLISQDEFNTIAYGISQIDYLIASPYAQSFLEKSSPSLTQNTPNLKNLDCLYASLLVGINGLLCGFQIYAPSCFAAILGGLSLFEICQGDNTPPIPCEDVTGDPCCDVVCVNGYTCVNGNCVSDGTGCNATGCPIGYRCGSNNTCIPL